MLKKIVILWLIAFVSVMAGVVFADSVSVDDQTLEKNVRSNLEMYAQSGSYTVISYKNHILLAGQVPTLEVRQDAENAVKKVPGVVQVWNYLKLFKNEAKPDLAKDSYLTSMAKAKLLTKKEINSNNIKVVTVDRVIYLFGDNPGNHQELDEEIRNIKLTHGVKDVVNLIF